MNKKYCFKYSLAVWVALILCSLNLVKVQAQNPVAPAQGFNVFVQQGSKLVTNETEGAIAIGGDLTVAGNYQVNIHNVGSFSVNSTPVGLLVGGKVILQSGVLQVNNNRYVQIGDCSGSGLKVWYRDNNNAASTMRITGSASSYSSTPAIQINANATTWGSPEVSASNNPVCNNSTNSLIDFSSAFTTMKASSTSMAACASNAVLTNPNGNVTGTTIPSVLTSGQLKINLADGINVLNVTGSELNSVTNGITFNQQPSASKVLVINVNAAGSFTWNVWNQAGIGGVNAPYILYNFYNTTSLNIAGNSTIEGTVFAPYADISKTVNQSNIEGQIIAQSYFQSGGENHHYPFNASVSGCATPCSNPVVADITGSSSVTIGSTITLSNTTSGGTWSSATPSVATISNTGVVTPVASGTSVISYSITNSCGTTTKTVNVTVTCAVVSPSSCNGFTTYTQGGWGGKGAPAKYLESNFAGYFPTGITIGCGSNTIKFTTAQAIIDFLPQGGTPAKLTGGNITNPGSVNITVLAGQLLAATLNAGFDDADASFSTNNSKETKDLVYKGSGFFNGMTVSAILAEANKFMGGCATSGSYSASELNEVLTSFNENYDNGTVDQGDFSCGSQASASVVPPTVNSPLTYCLGDVPPALTATGSNLTWYLNSPHSGTSTAPTPSAGSVGEISYYVTQTINGCESAQATILVKITDCNVSPGGSGGVESKSLGDIITVRTLTQAKNGKNGPVDYAILPAIQPTISKASVFGNQKVDLGISNVRLINILPSAISNLTAYETTPTDLTSFTNAVEVAAVDFAKNNNTKAVAFATKTYGEVYNHSKTVCDRLKGAQLLALDQMQANGFSLLRFKLKNAQGQIEYATAFSIGKNIAQSFSTLQSKWLATDYVSSDEMYNVQLWAATADLLNEMAAQVLSKVANFSPIATANTVELPTVYVQSGKREQNLLQLKVINNTSATSGYVTMKVKANEQSVYTEKTIPVVLNVNGTATVNIQMNDQYEGEIGLYINNQLKDYVYMSDGAWAVDYDKATTQLHSFTVTNSYNRVFDADEFAVMRNVRVQATTAGYVTTYKILKGGGIATDLSAYKSLYFQASGAGTNLRITLVKNSITDWKQQYSVLVPLSGDQKEYAIALSEFKSSLGTVIEANDVTTIIMSFENTSNGSFTGNIANIRFSKTDIAYLSSLNTKEISVYPNPATTAFTCSFKSNASAELTLRITDLHTGRLVLAQKVMASVGNNAVPVNMTKLVNGKSNYAISIEGNGIRYQPKLLFIDKK